MLAYVHDSDLRFSGRLRRWTPPRWFRVCMIWATRLGDGWCWGLVALLLAAGGSPHSRALAASALAGGLANVAQVVLKRRFRRARPCELAPHPLFALIRPPDRYSFPSGHALNAFAIGTVLALHYPALAPLVGLLSASIAVSRVVLGLHFVSDVLAGAALGLALGLLSFLTLPG
jgi:undecaprenyl-diphosphatase